MSHLITAYANYCGVEPSKPQINPLFYPIIPEKYLILHDPLGENSYPHWRIVLQALKPVLNKENIKTIELNTQGGETLLSSFCDYSFNHLNYQQIFYVIGGAECYLGIDDFIMHMASMHDKKIISLSLEDYPANNKPFWNKSSPFISLSPDFSKEKPLFGRASKNSRLKEIMPEEIVQAVIKQIKGFCNEKPMSSLHIGDAYENSIIEIIPNFFNENLVEQNRSANIRGDLFFDQDVLSRWVSVKKVNVFLNAKDINKFLFLARFKSNIHQLNVFVDLYSQKEQLKKLKKLGIPIVLLCKDQENLSQIRINLIDWVIEDFQEKTKKDIDNFSDIDYSITKFNSTKTVLSNNFIYPSLYHAINDEKNTDKLFDDPLFWTDINHFYIYNNYAKRTT